MPGGPEEGEPVRWAFCQSLPHGHPCTHQTELANVNIPLLASDFYNEEKTIQDEGSRVPFPFPSAPSPEATPGKKSMYFSLIHVFTHGHVHVNP